MARTRRETPHGEEWVFPVGFFTFWVIAILAILIVGLIVLVDVV